MTNLIKSMFLSGLLSAGMAATPGFTIEAESKTANKAWPKTLIERVREFLNLEPVEAVGGSRGNESTKVCLISPVSSRDGTKHTIWIGLSDPIIASSEPLNEIIVERNGIPTWSKLASSNQFIDQPIIWPIAPLKPGERVTLKLRPVHASGMDFVEFYLIALTDNGLVSTENIEDDLRQENITIIDAIRQAHLLNQRNRLAQLMSSRLAWEVEGAAGFGGNCR